MGHGRFLKMPPHIYSCESSTVGSLRFIKLGKQQVCERVVMNNPKHLHLDMNLIFNKETHLMVYWICT